jgi:hypothetical protein
MLSCLLQVASGERVLSQHAAADCLLSPWKREKSHVGSPGNNTRCIQNNSLHAEIGQRLKELLRYASKEYSNPSVYEQSVYEFTLIRDAQINMFSIYEPIFACTSSFLSQTDRCSRRLFSGSNRKLIFVSRLFALRVVLEERIKLVNRGISVTHYDEICLATCFIWTATCLRYFLYGTFNIQYSKNS